MDEKEFSVNVSPEMQFYKIIQRQPYKLESALAEFIDNSVQSFIENKPFFDGIGLSELNLSIKVNSVKNNIIIEDNAGGISRDDFQKSLAMGIDETPHLEESLSVYGVGMKTAAIWLSDKWSIETSTLKTEEKLFTVFNLNQLLDEKQENIKVTSESEVGASHYTKIEIYETLRRESKEYYEDIILPELQERFFKFKFLTIKIYFDEYKLSAPDVFSPNAPLYYPEVDTSGEKKNNRNITWERNIDINYNGYDIKGFIRIMEEGSYKQPGIRLLRNNRLILGTEKNANMPYATANKFSAQRIYGELELTGVPINFMKTGFDINLDGLYNSIKEELEKEPNLMQQAENFRQRVANRNKSTKRGKHGTGGKTRKPQRTKSEKENIEYSEELFNTLKNLGNEKFYLLYESLCYVSLTEDPVLAYVGTWSLLESLAFHLGKEEKETFPKFYNKEIEEYCNNNKIGKKQISDYSDIFTEINRKGNANKHSPKKYDPNAQSLNVNFSMLTPFLIYFIEKFLSEKNN